MLGTGGRMLLLMLSSEARRLPGAMRGVGGAWELVQLQRSCGLEGKMDEAGVVGGSSRSASSSWLTWLSLLSSCLVSGETSPGPVESIESLALVALSSTWKEGGKAAELGRRMMVRTIPVPAGVSSPGDLAGVASETERKVGSCETGAVGVRGERARFVPALCTISGLCGSKRRGPGVV